MDYETLLYDQDGHVVTITYNRPDQHNAINRRMNEELQHSFQRFRDDDSAFVLVITGAGDATFCAGWDLQDAADWGEFGDYDRLMASGRAALADARYDDALANAAAALKLFPDDPPARALEKDALVRRGQLAVEGVTDVLEEGKRIFDRAANG